MSGRVVFTDNYEEIKTERKNNAFLVQAPELVRSYCRAMRKPEEQVAEILEKALPLSKKNSCLNCIHSRTDMFRTRQGYLPRITDRVCYYSLRSTECQPVEKEPPEAEEIVSMVREVARGLIDSFAFLLKKERASFRERFLVRAIILSTGLSKKNPCLNCQHARAGKPKVLLRLREAGRIDILARACVLGLSPEICGEDRKPFIEEEAAKIVVLRRKVFASFP